MGLNTPEIVKAYVYSVLQSALSSAFASSSAGKCRLILLTWGAHLRLGLGVPEVWLLGCLVECWGRSRVLFGFGAWGFTWAFRAGGFCFSASSTMSKDRVQDAQRPYDLLIPRFYHVHVTQEDESSLKSLANSRLFLSLNTKLVEALMSRGFAAALNVNPSRL